MKELVFMHNTEVGKKMIPTKVYEFRYNAIDYAKEKRTRNKQMKKDVKQMLEEKGFNVTYIRLVYNVPHYIVDTRSHGQIIVTIMHVVNVPRKVKEVVNG